MAITVQAQNLNVRPGNSSQTVVHLSQGDTGNTIRFFLYDGNSEFDVSSYTVTVHGVRADGVGWGPYATSPVANHNNGVQFNPKSLMTSVAGASVCQFVIANWAGAAVGTANFAFLVENATFPDGPVYANDVSVYSQILAYVQGAVIPTEAVVIDPTLSIEGAAADSKAVGTALATVSSAVSAAQASVTEVKTPLAIKTAGTFSSQSRGIFIPYAFEKGKTYRVKLLSSEAVISYIRITKAATINSGDSLVQWNVNGHQYSKTYECDSTEAAYIAVVAPVGTASNTINFALYEDGPLTQVDMLTGMMDSTQALFEQEYVAVTPVSHPGYAWSVSDGKTLSVNASTTAWEFKPSVKHCILKGLQIGIADATAVIFLDASDKIISIINSVTHDSSHEVPITIPAGCVTVRYTSYTNATWDADPRQLTAIPVPESLDRYVGAKLYGTFSAASRAVVIPYAFTQGESYYLRLLSSLETVTEIRITKAATLDSEDILAKYSVNGKTADLSFYAYGSTATHIVVLCASDVTTNTITFELLRQEILSESDKLRGLLGVVASGRYATQTRAVIVPCNFKAGVTHYIDVMSSAQIITEMRVTKAPTLNAGDMLHQWYPNARAFEKIYVPDSDLGKYLVLYSDPEIASNTVDLKVLSSGFLRDSREEAGLPDYYYADNYWPGVLDNIRSKTKFVDGVAFAFVTDVHFPANAMNSQYMLRDVLEKTMVPFIICGGDFPAAYGTEADLIESGNDLTEYRSFIGKDVFFSIRGNHDFTIKTDSSMTTGAHNTGATLPVGDAYDYICRPQERFLVCSDPEHMAWYIDIPAQKVRIVGVNSCDGQSSDETASWAVDVAITQAQLEWLVNEALSADGYRYVIISHVASDPELRGYQASQAALHQILVAFKNHETVTAGGVTADFTESTSTLICQISGHSHHDESNVDDNLLSIATTCDAYYTDDGHGAVRGTITEQAFDVFCVDFDAKSINAVRAGRGTSRSWTYA